MTAQLGLGTYLQSEDDLREVLARAHHFGFDLVDTSTNYGHGVSPRVVGQYLRQARTWNPKVVTKVGYVTDAMIANQNIPASVLSDFAHRQCFSSAYIEWQARRSAETLNVEALLLHNPERQRKYLPEGRFEDQMVSAFEALERQRQAGSIRSYGVAIWDVSVDAAWNTAAYWAGLVTKSVGHLEGFKYFQHPVNLVDIRSIVRIGTTDSDISFCRSNGIATIASSPLRGGELLTCIDRELADLIRPGSSAAEAAFLASMSVPGLDWVLTGTRQPRHIDELVHSYQAGPVDEATLRTLSEVLA
jgi:aryl-alcohol dehydrogenase-like predicted oxidoreductase